MRVWCYDCNVMAGYAMVWEGRPGVGYVDGFTGVWDLDIGTGAFTLALVYFKGAILAFDCAS
jgi:hypothetical protein